MNNISDNLKKILIPIFVMVLIAGLLPMLLLIEDFGSDSTLTWIISILFILLPVIIAYRIFRSSGGFVNKIITLAANYAKYSGEKGIQAEAEILHINEHAKTEDVPFLNFNAVTMEVRVTGPDGSSYTTETGTIVPLQFKDEFRVGNKLPVRIDKDDKSKMMVDFERLGDYTGKSIEELPDGSEEAEWKTGLMKIVSVKPAGTSSGGRPLADVKCEIIPAGGERYSFTKQFPMSEKLIEKLNRGVTAPCRINPNDKSDVRVV